MRTKIGVFLLASAAFLVGVVLGRPPFVGTVEAQSCYACDSCMNRCSISGSDCARYCPAPVYPDYSGTANQARHACLDRCAVQESRCYSSCPCGGCAGSAR